MEQARIALARRLVIDVDAELTENGFVDELREILEPASRGNCAVYLNYQSRVAQAEIALGSEWNVNPSGGVLERLSQLAGPEKVHVIYP